MIKKIGLVLLALTVLPVLLHAANEDVDYTVTAVTGTYANRGYSPKSGATLDKLGNAYNMVDDFWKKANSIAFSGNVSVSTSEWTVLITTPNSNVNRIGFIIDSYATNSANMLIAITTSPLMPSTTDQGYTLKPADAPWIISAGSMTYIKAISLHTSSENLYMTEVK